MTIAKFKAWYVPQVPMKAFEVECASAAEAFAALDLITDFSIFEFDNKIKPDYSDVGGVVEWDETEQDWSDYETRSPALNTSAQARLARTAAAGEAVTHLLYHLDGQQILAEATLGQVLGRLATWSFGVTGAPVRYDPTRALQTLSLVVAS